jgi:hypothetical protein
LSGERAGAAETCFVFSGAPKKRKAGVCTYYGAFPTREDVPGRLTFVEARR